jgi:predicted tellurium resistance membrane protein TerC
MENTFTSFEIIIFFLSLFYFLYYILEKFILTYINIKKIIKPDRKTLEEKAEKIKKIANQNKDKQEKNKTKTIKISPEQNKKIKEIIKRVQINTSK